MSTFSERFDSYFGASQDLRCYSESKGYRYEGDYVRYWEPQDWTDLEDYGPSVGPGALSRFELEDCNCEQEEF